MYKLKLERTLWLFLQTSECFRVWSVLKYKIIYIISSSSMKNCQYVHTVDIQHICGVFKISTVNVLCSELFKHPSNLLISYFANNKNNSYPCMYKHIYKTVIVWFSSVNMFNNVLRLICRKIFYIRHSFDSYLCLLISLHNCRSWYNFTVSNAFKGQNINQDLPVKDMKQSAHVQLLLLNKYSLSYGL